MSLALFKGTLLRGKTAHNLCFVQATVERYHHLGFHLGSIRRTANILAITLHQLFQFQLGSIKGGFLKLGFCD